MFREKLEELLSESPVAAQEKAINCWEHLLKNGNNKVVLFGSGNLGKKICDGLRKFNIEPLAFSDNSPQRWGTTESGIPVLEPAKAAELFGESALFVVSIYSPGHRFETTRKQLVGLGCKTICSIQPLFWRYPEEFLPHLHFSTPVEILKHKDRILQSFDILDDEESRKQFVMHLQLRIDGDYSALAEPSPEDQYFPLDIVSLDSKEYFIDCGAFTGDTIQQFLSVSGECFRKIVAFEPDPKNYTKLTEYWSGLNVDIKNKIVLNQLATASEKMVLRFDATGGGGAAINQSGNVEVEAVALDEFLLNEIPSMIKMDIEGAEEDTLRGATRLITKYAPKLAVCIYHRPKDFWELPVLMKQFHKSYKIFIRSHGEDGLDTVCYAISDNK